jgi:thiopeptide-type bacteriocin biosynthesis protein
MVVAGMQVDVNGDGREPWNATEWLFVQLYPGNAALLDSTVLETVKAAALQALDLGADRWFFLRYTDMGGPHIRLRVRGDTDTVNAIHQRWRPSLLPSLENQARRPEASVRPRIVYLPYEPEVGKYGGRRGVELAEEAFQVSSTAALDLIAISPDRVSRLALAALVVKRYCTAMRSIDTLRFLEFHRDYWIGAGVPSRADSAASKEVRLGLQQEEREGPQQSAISAMLDRVTRAASASIEGTLAQGFRVSAYSLLMHHMHLTLNRIGIGLIEEFELARSIAAQIRGCGSELRMSASAGETSHV